MMFFQHHFFTFINKKMIVAIYAITFHFKPFIFTIGLICTSSITFPINLRNFLPILYTGIMPIISTTIFNGV